MSGRSMVVVAAVMLAACGAPSSDGAATGPPPSSSGSSEPPPPAEIGAWVAVYDTADDPQALSAGRREILRSLGDALAGDLVISPSGCLDGLPDTVAEEAYVLAVQQPQRAYVEALAEQLDGHPMFTGKVTVICTD